MWFDFCIKRGHLANYVNFHEDVCFVTTQSTVISQMELCEKYRLCLYSQYL